MPKVSVKKQLIVIRQDLSLWRSQIHETVMVCGFIIFPLLVVLPAIILAPVLEPVAGPAETWFDFKGSFIGSTFGVILALLMVTLAIMGPLWVIPRLIDGVWARQYRRVFKVLEETELPLMILDEAALAPLWTTLERQPLLHLLASSRPKTIEQRIEFASDYWRATLLIAHGKQRHLYWAIVWGNATRLVDDISPLIYNACVSIIIMVILAPLIIVVLPIWMLVLNLTILQQASQAAMLDYFINQVPFPLQEYFDD